jgi:hypothetical protein
MLTRLPPPAANRLIERAIREWLGMSRPVLIAMIVVAFAIVIGLMLIVAVPVSVLLYGEGPGAIGTIIAGFVILTPITIPITLAHVTYDKLRSSALSHCIRLEGAGIRLIRCATCDYDQTGTTGGVCPECGELIEFEA